MPKIITALLCLIIISKVNGQIPSIPVYPKMDADLFHIHLIKDNGISEIRAEYAYKYDLKNLHFTQKEAHYFFNSDGQLIKKIEKNKYHSSKDNVLDLYFYDAENRLSTHLHTDAQSSTVYLYEYDSSSYRASAYLIPVEKSWNENLNDDYLLWSDSIHIADNKHIYYNRFNSPYKYVVHRSQNQGQNMEISEYLKSGKINRSHLYSYAPNGLLLSIEERNYSEFQFDWKKEFTYRIEDNLEEEHYYKNGKIEHIRRISYRDDGLPEFDIMRNEETTRMTIVQFTYLKSK